MKVEVSGYIWIITACGDEIATSMFYSTQSSCRRAAKKIAARLNVPLIIYW